MKLAILAFLVLLVVGILWLRRRFPETLVTGGYDEEEMSAAIARARQEVDTFIAALEKGEGSHFAVKVGIEDHGDTEHFWLSDVVYRDGSFDGTVGNDPGVVRNVKLGQKWRVAKDEVSDWMFLRDGKIHGNYTMRPLLKTMSEAEAQAWRGRLAEP